MSGGARPGISADRARILAFRRHTGSLDERMESGSASLERAACAGLQDSVPRSALLSLHARVAGVGPSDWEAPSLAQVWGPRYTAHVVPARDHAAFTLGRLPDDARGRERAERMAALLRDHLGGERRRYDEVGAALGVDPNALRYAATTGTVLIRWEGAALSQVWTVAAPDGTPARAREELARRYLHVYGPATPPSFARWAGISDRGARNAFAALASSSIAVATPSGPAWILAADEPAFRDEQRPPAPARLLPSGDPYFLHHGLERELLVRDPAHRELLWPSRVWPGAVMIDGEIRGTWRRSDATVTVALWRSIGRARRAAVEAEAAALPLPGLTRAIDVVWS